MNPRKILRQGAKTRAGPPINIYCRQGRREGKFFSTLVFVLSCAFLVRLLSANESLMGPPFMINV